MRLLLLSLLALAVAPVTATAGSPIVLTLRNHRFSPAEITVPAGEKVSLKIVNRDGASDEFDSVDLMVEAPITPHGEAAFTVGPLKPGRYAFQGELHPATAQGMLIAR